MGKYLTDPDRAQIQDEAMENFAGWLSDLFGLDALLQSVLDPIFNACIPAP